MSRCMKIGFPTRGAARAWIRGVGASSTRNRSGKTAYVCERCGEWHITSQTKVESRSKKARLKRS